MMALDDFVIIVSMFTVLCSYESVVVFLANAIVMVNSPLIYIPNFHHLGLVA